MSTEKNKGGRQKMNDASHLWMSAIINFSDDAIISKDLNDLIVSWNKGAEILYGYTANEAIGKPISIIIPEDKISDISISSESIENRKFISHFETTRIAKDGKRIDVSLSLSPIIDEEGILIGSSAIARDITERKKNEEIIKLSEERYRKIVELSSDAIYIHKDGEIIFINAAGLKLFGATDYSQLIGKSIWSLYTPDRHGIVRARAQLMKTTNQAVSPIEHTIIRLDGKIVNVESNACPITYAGQSAIYITLRDISEHKKIKMLLEMQYSIANGLIDFINLTDSCANVLKIICTNLKLDIGKIWVINKKDNNLSCIATYGNIEIDQKSDDSLLNKVLANEELCWVEDVTQLVNSTYPHDYEFKFGIGVPIINEKKVIGVLELMNHSVLIKDNLIYEAMSSIGSQISQFMKRRQCEKDLIYISKHDSITGLFNHSFLEEILNFELYRAKIKDQRLAVLLLNIMNFSSINHALGHAAGDELLKQVATRLVTLTSNSDNIVRFRDAQFAVVLIDFWKIEDIIDFVEELNNTMIEPFIVREHRINVSFNVGVGLYPEDGDSVASLIRSADIALYDSKKSGANSLQFCTNNMTALAKKRVGIENDLREALTKQEFFLSYQPIVEIPSMVVIGFESLIRWRKNGKIVSPSEFIHIIEETLLIVPIGEWILHTACVQCKSWQDIFKRPIVISVNVSTIQLRHSSIIDVLTDVLQKSKLDPSCLKLEITESAIMSDAMQVIKILHRIKDMGIKIAIDDFGTGYSSLNYLKQLPIDYLKIDQSFVVNMLNNHSDAAIIKTIISLAENLGYKVIAEGIETEEQLNFITNLGCVEIQGYYFGAPMESDEVIEFLKQKTLFNI